MMREPSWVRREFRSLIKLDDLKESGGVEEDEIVFNV
jgi:hypothetical protein